MAFDFNFNRIREDVLNAGKNAGDLMNEAAAAARTRIEIHNKEELLKSMYEELGRAYFQTHQAEEVSGNMKDILASIQTTLDEIDQLKHADLTPFPETDTAGTMPEMGKAGNPDMHRNTAGKGLICPICGAKLKPEAKFCPACGAAR